MQYPHAAPKAPAAPAKSPIARTVHRFGRGAVTTSFSGKDRDAVLEAALDFYAAQDSFLNPTLPATYAGPEGTWRADVTVWSAE